LYQSGGGLQQIFDRQLAYDPLHFPLLFPHGELGWHLAVWYQGDTTSRNTITEFNNVSLPQTDSTPRQRGTHCCKIISA